MMKQMTLALFLILVLSSAACEKQENDAVIPVRLAQDTVSLQQSLETGDPLQAKAGLASWLSYFPDEINRVFPDSATTPYGLVALKYFAASPELQDGWRDVLLYTLDRGANPNVEVTFEGQRRGIVHLAVQRADQVLIKALIGKLGLAQPPLRLSCDTGRGQDAGGLSRADSAKSTRIDLNLQESAKGWTPLHYAVKALQPDPQLIEYLLLQGANPDLSDTSFNLLSPYQLVEADPFLASMFRLYSGAQIRYDSRLNSFINDEIEASVDLRKKLPDLAKEYRNFVQKEGLDSVQDINRVVSICETEEKLNVLGYGTLYLIPSYTVAAQGAARNQAIGSWIKEFGANFCSTDLLKIRAPSESGFREINLKTLMKETLVASDQDTNAQPNGNLRALRMQNNRLWCDTIRPHAIEKGCWTAEDQTLSLVNTCQSL
jgi:hypothetical protein